MSNLKEYRLGDCVELVIDHRGKTPTKMGGDWVDDGIRVISALNVHNGIIDNEDQIRCVSEEVYKRWMTEDIQRNDCFIASEGASLGENTIWDSEEKIVLGQRLYAIRTNPNILDPWYFAAYMQTSKFRLQIDQISTGSTVFGISQPVLLNVKLLLPDIIEQRKIGLLYKNIKRKIQTNNKINAELESMAKTIYDYWFLQFEFPNEEGKPYKLSGGKMVWNEELKREIPEGWEVETLGDILEKINESITSIDAKKYPYTPMDSLPCKKMSFGNYKNGEEAKSSLLKYDKNAILFGAMRAYFHRVCIAPFEGVTRTTTFVFYPKNNDILGYVYETLNLDSSVNYAVLNSIGTQQPYAVWENNFEKLKLSKPPYELKLKYSSKIKAIIESVIHNELENQELSSLRDFLLPLLMNGQVGFKEEALAEVE